MSLKRSLRSPLRPAALSPLQHALIAGGVTAPPGTPAFTITLDNLVGLTGGGTTNVFMTGSSGGGGVVVAAASASRLTGVAPLYVNFDATATTSTASTNPSHELFFAWDFGDPGAGTWANGVQSPGLTNKNTAYGPVVGHVFETPGTYVVTPVAIDGDPAHTASRAKTVTVLDPNVVYAGALTICISHSGNFTGAPSGATQVNTAGNTDMRAALNGIADKNNKRILFCKADAWTCSAQNTFTGISGMTISGYGTGAARAAVFNASASDTLVDVTPAAIGGSVFNFNAGNSDIRIHNFKINGNTTAKAVGLNNSISAILFSKVELRGSSGGFTAYPGGGGTNNVFDQHCLYECVVDDYASTSSSGFGVFVGLVRGGIMGCYFDNCNYGEGVVRLPYLDRAHINNNYIARPNQTKNILKIHSFSFTDIPLYSEKFVVSANVLDLRGGYSYNGTTVTEVGDCGILIGNGGNYAIEADRERVRNGIVESNYTYGCRGDPKVLYFVTISCPNMTVRNNIADFLLGSTSAPYAGTYSSRGALFCVVNSSTPDPTVGVRIYNNSLYCNMDNGTSYMVNIQGAATAQVDIKNNISYQPYIGYWADKIVYLSGGATLAAYTASNNTVNQNTNPLFTATPPVALADWKPATGSYAINGGASVQVLRDFNNASRVGAGNHMGAILP